IASPGPCAGRGPPDLVIMGNGDDDTMPGFLGRPEEERDVKITTTTTFEVSDVVRAVRPLPEVPYKQAIEALLTEGSPAWEDGWEDDEDALITDGPEPTPPRPVEACTRYHGRLVGRVAFHPFVAAVHNAFMSHRPLHLSPDLIWLLMCQGVAN